MNILILTDFSEASVNAGRYAVDFLKEISANFYLLNIHHISSTNSARNYLESELANTIDKLQQGAEDLEEYSNNKNHQFNTILSSENLISAVRKLLVEKKINLIFIGAASQEDHAHPILGDHAYDVVRKIKCNMIAVPAGCFYSNLKRAIFPVDDSIFPIEDQKKILNDLDYLNSLDFKILEIRDGEMENPFKNAEYEIQTKPVPFTKALFKDIQKHYDMIFVIGKNLSICDQLLHTEHGFSANMDVEIPIFVYHG